MKELIEEALRVSCLLWNADIEKVRNNTSRLKNNVRAKRMFVYYIYSFLKIFNQFMHKMNLYSVYGSGYMEKRKEIEKLKQELIDFINK